MSWGPRPEEPGGAREDGELGGQEKAARRPLFLLQLVSRYLIKAGKPFAIIVVFSKSS